jgi:SAM-dependent methyltransferase
MALSGLRRWQRRHTELAVERWRKLLELAEVTGRLCAVDARPGGRGRSSGPAAQALADLACAGDVSCTHVIDSDDHVLLPFADASCDAIVLGPRVSGLDETERDTLLDEGRRVLRPGGHLMIVVPSGDPSVALRLPDLEWLPGTPPGWWSEALDERFAETRYARFSRRLDVILAVRNA